jgi:RimJ/RimL family protein N-acetyltransferase
MATRRMLLSVPQEADADELFVITSDPETWHHAPSGRHESIETTRAWITRARELWTRDGLSYWLCRAKEGGAVTGVGGVQRQETRNWNLHYRFAPRVWGQGFAVELGHAALSAANAYDPDVAVIAWVPSHNEASQRVAERLGLTNRGAHVDPSDGLTRLAFSDRQVPLA